MPDTKTTITLPARLPYSDKVELSVDSKALHQAKPDSKHIVVVGAGVSGLMTAWILLDQGYKVTILAEHWTNSENWVDSRLTSQIAGALWEFPPGGCGVTEMTKVDRGWADVPQYEEWALQSFEFYTKLMDLDDGRYKAEYGLTKAKLTSFFYKTMNDPAHAKTGDMDEEKLSHIEKNSTTTPTATLEKRMTGYKRHLKDLHQVLETNHIGEPYKTDLKDAYTHDAPIINTDKAMIFLMALLGDKGAEFETVRLDKLDKKYLDSLGYHPDGVINATGLGARDLVGDQDVFPVRGAIKRMSNAKHGDFDNLNQAYLVPSQIDPHNPDDHIKTVFLVPRSDDILIVGSIVQPNINQLNLTANSPEVDKMWKRARTFLPSLQDAQPRPEYPLAQGLRPFTAKNVKVRADNKSDLKLVHNYGHGGSGWTLAAGCARTAAYLLTQMLKDSEKTANVVNEALYGAVPAYYL